MRHDRDELLGYGLFAGVGAMPITGAVVHHTGFGVEPTIGLAMVAFGAIGLGAAVWHALRGRDRWFR